MFKENKNLAIIALIAIVNAIGYGIIIPVLYSYSQRFGLTDFQNGLLFALFSICQFLSTPIIGRLSDKYGRKPLLILSLLGTVVSFFLMAFAPNAIFLFLARAIDGITAGNIPVAMAVISDTTQAKDRAKGFGIIGAAFGFGFIFGPAISGLTTGFGAGVPFIIAAVVSLIAVILTWAYLPETNKHMGEVKKGPFIDLVHLIKAVTDENVGLTLLVTFLYFMAFSLFIYAYQPVSVKVLHLSTQLISLNFTLFGVVGLIAQGFLIPKISKRVGERTLLMLSLFVLIFAFFGFYFVSSYFLLLIVSLVLGLANSFVQPMLQTILSKETDEKSQGSIFGLSASYMSIGQIVGPILGGIVATHSIPMPFLVGSGIILVCFFLSILIHRPRHKQSAF
jgi:MFS family permease